MMFYNPIKRLLFSRRTERVIEEYRRNRTQTAILFVHGFSGSAGSTWSDLLSSVNKLEEIANWDLYSINYSSHRRIDFRIWSADAGIEIISQMIRTTLQLEPLSSYERIAIVAHSMGGLAVQRAILNDVGLRRKLSHVIFFGTPSAGLELASLGRSLKRQFRDMGTGSPFIERLRQSWALQFPNNPPFRLLVVAGETDAFVPPESSLGPFKDEFRRVIRGDHASMLVSNAHDIDASQVIAETICNGLHRTVIDSARLAVEMGEFQDAIEALLPRADALDANATSILALALETLGQTDEAIAIIERHRGRQGAEATSDALGVLGGRIKRRWLVGRLESDLRSAIDLYSEGLRLAEATNDYAQCHYHAVNIAFLKIVSRPLNSSSVEGTAEAERALYFCGLAEKDHWCLASMAEANLMLGKVDDAANTFRQAVGMMTSPREILSMRDQAFLLLDALKVKERKKIEEVFQRPMEFGK